MRSTEERVWPRNVAIIGSGTMGLGVAETFAAAGIRTRISDETPEQTRQAKDRLVERARGHAEAGLLAAEVIDRAEAVEVADDLPGVVRDVDLVFEAVPEDLGLKHDVTSYSHIEK